MQLSTLLIFLLFPHSSPFVYRPSTGLTWDPTCIRNEGKTYCYFMYVCGSSTDGCNGTNSTHYDQGLVTVSEDGVHFTTHSAFDAEFEKVSWFKCMVHKLTTNGDPIFVMNQGTSGFVTGPDDPTISLPKNRGCPGTATNPTQCLRFLTSSDLLNWTYVGRAKPGQEQSDELF